MEATTHDSSTNDAAPASSPRRARAATRHGQHGVITRYRGALVCVGLLAAGAALVSWARTSPGYDPYGWLV